MIDFECTQLDPNDPYSDLQDMTREQLMGQIIRYRKYIETLEEFQKDAFMVSPNIDLDIEYMRKHLK